MKTPFLAILIILASLLMPVPARAEAYNSASSERFISQPLVREGDFALRLAEALRIANPADEFEAESILASEGIIPANGWIADYPVTPDIVGELEDCLRTAAGAGTLPFGEGESLEVFWSVLDEYGLVLVADVVNEGEGSGVAPEYPDAAALDDYYYTEGPPVVTWYAPPRGFAYLYRWVPCSFRGWTERFRGFFVLADFHKVDRSHNVITNRFVHPVTRAPHRVDPGNRRYASMTGGKGRIVVGPSGLTGGNKVSDSSIGYTSSANAPRSSYAGEGKTYSAPVRQGAVDQPYDGARALRVSGSFSGAVTSSGGGSRR